MDDQLTFGNLLTQSSSLADLDFSQKSYLSIYSHATLSHMVLPNDAKVLKYKTFCEVVNNEKVLKLVINTLDNPSSEPKSSTLKEIDEPPKICISETVDNTNSVGRIQPKFFRTSDGVAKNRTCQRILSQPDLHSSLESRSRATPNNNRYNLRETSEDDIINKFSEDEGDSLKQTPTERQEQGLDQILENDTLFSKKRDRNLKRDNNTIDYFNTGTQNEIEEKLKTRSYNGTHKRHETVNFGTEANFLTEDGFENHLAHSRRLIPKKSKVKKNSSTIGLNKNILKAKLITTSSFENFNDPVKLCTEHRKPRGAYCSSKIGFEEDRRVSDQVRIPSRFKENLLHDDPHFPGNASNQNCYKNKLIKKKSKTNSLNYSAKNGTKAASSKHSRVNSRSNINLGNDMKTSNQLAKSSARSRKPKQNSRKEKKSSKNSSKGGYVKGKTSEFSLTEHNPHLHKYITKEDQCLNMRSLSNDKENICHNEQSSNRFSDRLLKDEIFDSKDDSISGMNELNLLQELTNFTNMKMINKKKQHCIHFDRIIK